MGIEGDWGKWPPFGEQSTDPSSSCGSQAPVAIELHIQGLREEGLPVLVPRSEGEIVEVGAASLGSWRGGMSSSEREIYSPRASSVSLTEDSLVVDLVDGRTVTVPIAWYPRLPHGTHEERADFTLIGDGIGIHWPRLDEDISVEGILAGLPSGESQASLQEWLRARR